LAVHVKPFEKVTQGNVVEILEVILESGEEGDLGKRGRN
jgi:hypothetical protein